MEEDGVDLLHTLHIDLQHTEFIRFQSVKLVVDRAEKNK